MTMACNTENAMNDNSKDGKTFNIVGIIDDTSVKTTYDSEGKFSWLQNDKIKVQLTNGTDYSGIEFKANGAGVETSFSINEGTIADGYSVGDYAFYPSNMAYTSLGYFSDNPPTVSLQGHTYDYTFTWNSGSPLQTTPLIGKKVSESEGNVTFKFVSAAGLLKLNFDGVPNENGLRVFLEHPSYPLCGRFSLSTDNTILAENYISGKEKRILEPDPGFSTAYIALPIGTIPAGLVITVTNTSGRIYSKITTNADIVIERNTVTNMTTPIKAVSSTFDSFAGTSAAPLAVFSYGDGESIAVAAGSTEAEAISNLSGKTWYTSGSIPVEGLTTSGKYILAYKVKKNDHVYVKTALPETPFYFLSATYASNTYCKKHTSLVATETLSSGTLTLEVSDDPTKGQYMLTEIDGMDCRNPNLSHDHRFFQVKNWYDQEEYDVTKFSAGSPYYGIFDESKAGTANTSLVFYTNYSTSTNTGTAFFYYYGVPVYIYSVYDVSGTGVYPNVINCGVDYPGYGRINIVNRYLAIRTQGSTNVNNKNWNGAWAYASNVKVE